MFINEGDTLLIQPGAKVLMDGNFNFIVKGTFLSLGTQEKPIFITAKSAVKTDTYGADPTADPAYKGLWGGILCEPASKLVVLKWTHIEFGGGIVATSPVSGIANGANTQPVFFQNPDGVLVVEDSWFYGSLNDNLLVKGGKINIMRNTFEKSGFTNGEAVSIESGTVGNCAYNLIVGAATNGFKVTNIGGKNPQTDVAIFNNTIINSGFRRNKAGRGGSIDYEEGARGMAYNNIIVNSKFGLRVVGNGTHLGNTLVMADTLNLKYGHNYYYADSISVANEIYPTGFITNPKPTDIPVPSYLPAGYKPGQVYDGSAVLEKNDVAFVNFPLPQPNRKYIQVSFKGNYDFKLKPTSPAIAKGFVDFKPIASVPVHEHLGSTVISLPSKDLGAFPADNSGNKH
ncbi:MAG: hypothetical protein LRY55_01635 [Leadbetterella sp.]|nr:hypothetical protein [Leadbetterella sp.]